MGKKKKAGGKGKAKPGKGGSKAVLVITLLLGVGGAAFWFLAPEQAQAQLDSLKNILGL